MGKGLMRQRLALPALVVLLTACIPDLDRSTEDAGATPDIHESRNDALHGSDVQIYPSDVSLSDADGPVGADALTAADLGALDAKTDATADQLQSDTFSGKWYQANGKICPDFCSSLGMTNKAGPEGAHCMSGEASSASGIAQGIKFSYGCWKAACTGSTSYKATSHGKYCYRPGQKQDDDATDITVGCFCG